MKPKTQQTGIATVYRSPGEDKEPSKDLEGIEAAMKEFCDAMERKDHKAMARIFSDAFDLLEKQPHEEIEHKSE
jgi:hypothetical protein